MEMEYARLNAAKFGLAAGIAVFLLTLALFLLIWLTGGMMILGMGAGAGMGPMAVASGMMIGNAIVGGLSSAILTGVFAAIMAAIYNRLL